MDGHKQPEREPEVPAYIRDYVMRGAIAMENISRYIEQQNMQWPQLIDTLNSDFLVHNAKTDAVCKSIDVAVAQSQHFQNEVWSKTWKLVERILVVSISVISAIAGFRIVFGGIP